MDRRAQTLGLLESGNGSQTVPNADLRLLRAIFQGSKQIAERLIRNGAGLRPHSQHKNFATGLQAAAYYGEVDLIDLLLDAGANINDTGGCYQSALQAAASRPGQGEVVSLLLKHGAEATICGGRYGSALQAAAYAGNAGVVSDLVAEGADVDAPGGSYGTALQIAAFRGSEVLVDTLLLSKANVNAGPGPLGSALQLAIQNKHFLIVKRLVESGARVDVPGGGLGTAIDSLHLMQTCRVFLKREMGSDQQRKTLQRLFNEAINEDIPANDFTVTLHAAALHGRVDIVRQLWRQWGSTISDGGQYDAALQVACSFGQKDVVEFLLAIGIGVRNAVAFFGYPLQAAAYGGHAAIMQLLLDKGADVNAQGGRYGNALQAAVLYGHVHIVQDLLNAGVEVNATGGEYGSALQAAVASEGSNRRTLIAILLGKGANVNAYGGKFGTALHAAVFRHDVEVVRQLIHAKADVNKIHEGRYGSILHCACMTEDPWHEWEEKPGIQLELVKILLANDANVNARGGLYGTPLQAAAHYVGPSLWPYVNSHIELLNLLLVNGASPRIVDGKYGTPLQAVFGGCIATGREPVDQIVDVLLQHMDTKDINIQAGDYNSSLQAAIANRSDRIARRLIALGADVNISGGIYGGMVEAALSSHHELARDLISIHDAPVGPKHGHRGYPLVKAVATADIDLVNLLLDHGASSTVRVQLGGPNALDLSATLEDINILKRIWDFVEAFKPDELQTALQAAVRHGRVASVDFLIEKGAQIDAPSPALETPLQTAIASKDSAMIDHLLNKKALINCQSGFYWTALQAAISVGDPKAGLVRKLINLGADVNLQGGIFGTALQAAAVKGDIETVELLLDSGADATVPGGQYGTCLHAAVVSGDSLIILRIIAAGGQIDALDNSRRTPLHLAVLKGNISAVKQLLHCGARANIKDSNDLLPIHVAIQQRDCRIALTLLPTSGQILSDIPATEWRATLPGPFNSHLEIIAAESTTVSKRLDPDLGSGNFPLLQRVYTQTQNYRHYMLPDSTMPYEEEMVLAGQDKYEAMASDATTKRIFILRDGVLFQSAATGTLSVCWTKGTGGRWVSKENHVPSASTLGLLEPNTCFCYCRFTTPSVILDNSSQASWPTLSSTSELDMGRSTTICGIAWIHMFGTSSIESNEQNATGPRIFFSTSNYAEVPNDAWELLLPLTKQLAHNWDKTIQSAETYLLTKRREVLASRGSNPQIIRDLLGDALLWDELLKFHTYQVREVKDFMATYRSSQWSVLRPSTSQAAESDIWRIKDKRILSLIDEVYSEKLKAVARTTQDLIQLEFNLTSILEAQRSTSTNISMKRLSWITFIFLPLMYMASLLGMNIDILSDNPPWWWYCVLAAVLMLLTTIVWLIYKYSPNLEDRIEKYFDQLFGLFKAPTTKSWDVEQGWKRQLTPRENTLRFPLSGKKRS